MVTEADDKNAPNRPYPPPSNVITILHRLRTRNLPDLIDSEYLRDAQIPDGTNARTLSAMRFLGLIEKGGLLRDSLKAMHTSTDEEYEGILSGLIREAYKEVFNVIDPVEDSQEKILNVFRRYTPASQRDRMVVFFLGMCREAGIPTLDAPRARSMSAPRSTRVQKEPARETRSSAPQSRGGTARTAQIGLDPALEGLMRTLPAPGMPMTEDRRKQWLKMADATLRFIYPETESSVEESIEQAEESEQ